MGCLSFDVKLDRQAIGYEYARHREHYGQV